MNGLECVTLKAGSAEVFKHLVANAAQIISQLFHNCNTLCLLDRGSVFSDDNSLVRLYENTAISLTEHAQ